MESLPPSPPLPLYSVSSDNTAMCIHIHIILNDSYSYWAGSSGAGVYQTLSPTPLLLDATQTSMIEVPQNGASLGDYTCTASYHTDIGLDPSSVTETFILEAQHNYSGVLPFTVGSVPVKMCIFQWCSMLKRGVLVLTVTMCCWSAFRLGHAQTPETR